MSNETYIDMKEAIEILGITQPTFYRWLREGRIQGNKLGRRWRFVKTDIEGALRGESRAVSTPTGTEALIKELNQKISESGKEPVLRTDEPIKDLIATIIRLCTSLAATDVHLDAQSEGGMLRLRIDGVLHVVTHVSNDILAACVYAWKGLAHCNVQNQELPQSGLVEVLDGEDKISIHVCSIPTIHGESVTVRVQNFDIMSVNLDDVTFSQEHKERMYAALKEPFGLIIVSGPTGSGKSTTLYGMLNTYIKPEEKVMSIEDPVQFHLPGVTQLQVDAQKGMDFPTAMRACLRSDPDVLMIGEVRDQEVATLALQAAITGHVVITSMHASSMVKVIMSLREMGVNVQTIIEGIRLIVSQKLVRRVCAHCAEDHKLDQEQQRFIADICDEGGLARDALPKLWKKAVGCERCNGGYHGRTVINETISCDGAFRSAIIDGANEDELTLAARE
ncbi:MAG: Flp pilus assembly complex ATPase component TadA, partial [Planctomycetes bacterium]|nr:Flp pilus assembly complex ATPase component TadA [Planctomycetota bacterium]